jgi:hypothetical protein
MVKQNVSRLLRLIKKKKQFPLLKLVVEVLLMLFFRPTLTYLRLEIL